jgi:EAL and modified HD-GYP domain-containing signal transduction protein
MERVLVSRQPIFRTDMAVMGYELLFRDSDTESASISDGARATAQVINNSLMEIGMDELVGQHPAFVNFERTMLMGNYCESLPRERMVIEILESVTPDDAVMRRLRELRSKGYRIALDDFIFTRPISPLVEVANFVKLDVMASGWPAIEEAVAVLREYPLRLIAEKVETREDFERAKALGIDHFQGYFFCKPQNIKRQRLPVNRMAAIHLLTQLNKPDVRMDELEAVIGQNVSLSYKLLRYINSAMCGLQRQVESIRHATVLVGLERMRTWASLIVFSSFEEASKDVLVTGAVRARMCEQVANLRRFAQPERFFLVGLFSVLDAILDRPLDQVLPSLSLSKDISDALLEHKAQLGSVLNGVKAYERRDWPTAEASLGLGEDAIQQAYQSSMAWSMRTLSGLQN